MPATAIPERQNVPEQDKWNLDSLYSRPEDWEKDLKKLEGLIPGMDRFRGTLGDSPTALKACLDYTVMEAGLLEERLAYYAMLRREENVGDADGQGRYSRFVAVATRLAAAASWIEPELLSLDDDTWTDLTADESLADYRIYLDKMRRFRPHVLSAAEESLLARQAEHAQTARKAFSALTDVDFDYGSVRAEKALRAVWACSACRASRDSSAALRTWGRKRRILSR